MPEQPLDELLREGADSVFQYVRRIAEPTPMGTRWETLSFEDQPFHSPSPLDKKWRHASLRKSWTP